MKSVKTIAMVLTIILLLAVAGCSSPSKPIIGINSYSGNASVELGSQPSTQTENSGTNTSQTDTESSSSESEDEPGASSNESLAESENSSESTTTSLPANEDENSSSEDTAGDSTSREDISSETISSSQISDESSSQQQESNESSESGIADQTSSSEPSESTSSEDTSASQPSEDESDSSTSSEESSSEVQNTGTSSQPESSEDATSSEAESSSSENSEDTTSSEAESSSSPEEEEPPSLGGYEPLADEKRYCLKSGALDSDQKLLYFNIKTAIKMQKASLDISPSAKASAADVRLAIQSVNTDYPEYYWLSGDYTLYYSNDYITKIDFNYLPFNDAYTQALNDVVDEFCNNVPSDLSEYELELLAHDFICQNVEYDQATADGAANNPHAYSAYGALVNGLSVCEGYSRAMQLLMNRLGVQCSLIRGSANGDGHMWNVIQIDTKWYHLDVTWDDPVGAERFNHFFFNLPTTEILTEGHIVDPEFANHLEDTMDFNTKTPSCTETLYNYFTVNKTYLTAANEEKSIKNAIEKSVAEGITYCEFCATETSVFCGLIESEDKKSALASVLADSEISSFRIVSSTSAPNRFMICW